MVLASQTSRTGLSRRYMSSKKSRPKKWPWVLAGAGVVGVCGWFLLPGDDMGPSDAMAAEPAVAPADDEESRTPAESKPKPTRASDLSPLPSVAASAIPTITLNGQPATPKPAAPPAAASTSRIAAAPAATVPAPAAVEPRVQTPIRSSGGVATRMTQGMDLITEGRLIEGRRVLSELLFGQERQLAPADARTIRDTLMSINKELVFSPKVTAGDPVAESYRIQSGDVLARIAPRYKIPFQFLARINNVNPSRLMVGQSIKVIKGPLHARVHKSDYRMDLFVYDDKGQPIYIWSFPVGLGEGNSTPVGRWIVEEGRKVKNPGWANPRTGERYAPDDPENPIGEYWLALKGVEPDTESLEGYGIHGTTDPDSIGSQRSMGCVRLRDADIEQVFEMLQDGESTVEIVR